LKFIGDVHGHFQLYKSLLDDTPSFQVGDMGIGFDPILNLEMSAQHRFIRGNHDDPEMCRVHPNYAGEFGYDDKYGLFFLSGAWSIDKDFRIAYQKQTGKAIWWAQEELSEEQLIEAEKLYISCKPKVVVTHDCPESINNLLLSPGLVYDKEQKRMVRENANYFRTRTGMFLERLFQLHQPNYWLFGHYHQSWKRELVGTKFICLNELEVYEMAEGDGFGT